MNGTAIPCEKDTQIPNCGIAEGHAAAQQSPKAFPICIAVSGG